MNRDLDNFVSDILVIFQSKIEKYLKQFLFGLKIDKSIKIDFIISTSNDINAAATGKYPNYLISLNKGIIYATCRKVFELFELTNKFDEIIDENNHRMARSTSMALIIDYTLKYIVMHEFSHIISGHLDWLYSKHGIDKLNENSINKYLDKTTFHAMESHADNFALGPLTVVTGMEVYIVGIAISLLYSIFAQEANNFKYYNSISHPHPLLRWGIILRLIKTDIKNGRISSLQGQKLLEGIIDTLAELQVYKIDNLLDPIVTDFGIQNTDKIVGLELLKIFNRLKIIENQFIKHYTTN